MLVFIHLYTVSSCINTWSRDILHILHKQRYGHVKQNENQTTLKHFSETLSELQLFRIPVLLLLRSTD